MPEILQIAVGTLRSIVRQAGLTVAEFERLLSLPDQGTPIGRRD